MSPSRAVYLHVGLPKTGTTYLQRALWTNREHLSRRGVFVPGDLPTFHQQAARDLLGRRAQGSADDTLVGSWRSMVDQIQSSNHAKVVVSEEFLVYARPRHASTIARAVAPADLHIVVTVRDLGRVVGSAWQHELTKGHTWTWPQFVSAVRDPDRGGVSAGLGFWLRYDVRRILAVWEAVVPAERIHVVVVPQPGAAPTALLDRFAQAIGEDATEIAPPEREANVSVGVVEAEVLRRLNEGLGGSLNERQYVRAVKGAVLPALSRRSQSARIALSDDDFAWATEISEPWVEYLRTGGFDVVGDVEELMPRPRATGENTPDRLETSEITSATAAALQAVVESYARFWWKARRRLPAAEVATTTRVASSARSWGYRARVRALALADRNRLVAKAASAYLRRSSDQQ